MTKRKPVIENTGFYSTIKWNSRGVGLNKCIKSLNSAKMRAGIFYNILNKYRCVIFLFLWSEYFDKLHFQKGSVNFYG
jgi:hypothetical protein